MISTTDDLIITTIALVFCSFIALFILELTSSPSKSNSTKPNTTNNTNIHNTNKDKTSVTKANDITDRIVLKLCTTDSNNNTQYSKLTNSNTNQTINVTPKTFDKKPSNSTNANIINDTYSILTLKELLHKELKLGRVNYDDLKSNYEECLYILDKNNITKLYHFTSVYNLIQIKTSGGLLSWNKSQQHQVKVYNSIQSHDSDCGYSNNDDYVHLSFCVNHPMAYRLSKAETAVALLEINPIVALFKNTMFCDMDASDPACNRGSKVGDLERVNLAATQMHFLIQNSPYFKLNQAEVMVKTFVPKYYIYNLNSEIELFQRLGIISTSQQLTDYNNRDDDIPF